MMHIIHGLVSIAPIIIFYGMIALMGEEETKN